jgi:hypothetical protein
MFLGKRKRVMLGNPQAVNVDGLLMDVDIQQVDDNDNPCTCEDK